MPILEVKHVSKIYGGGTKALDDISFSVEEGEFVSVIGPSGAGKSTLLRCINCLVDATSGSVLFDGEDVTKAGKKALRRVRTRTGMIFQHYNLVERLSVIENVLHGRLGQKSTVSGMVGYYTEEEKKEAFGILERLGLADQAYKRCDELSGGQKQRVGIARAIMQKPRLILCDEPIASLDPSSSKTIMDSLREINRSMKITCLLNLHQVDVAVNYSERIIGITAGRIVYDGASAGLSEQAVHQIYRSGRGDLITDVKEEAIGVKEEAV